VLWVRPIVLDPAIEHTRLGADLDFRPDRSDGAIWTACWS
jgi:hypothetical protein